MTCQYTNIFSLIYLYILILLQDPSVRQTLQDMQENPAYAQKAMSDPVIRAKIEKLVAAGVLQVK